MATLTRTVAQYLAAGSYSLDDNVILADTGANIATLTSAQWAGLNVNGIDTINATDNIINLTVAQATVPNSAYTLIMVIDDVVSQPGQVTIHAGDTVTISDTGANIATMNTVDLQNLAYLQVDKIDATNNAFTFTAAQHDAAGAAGLAYAATDKVTVNGTANADAITGRADLDILMGFGGNDTLLGGTGNDTLNGGIGNDTLGGGIGNDNMVGDAGNDRLVGGTGNDLLNGGAGNDALLGDAGNDTFHFIAGSGMDVIADFEGEGIAGGDAIRLASNLNGSGILTANDALSHVTYDFANSKAVIDLGGGNIITVQGITQSFIAADFIIF